MTKDELTLRALRQVLHNQAVMAGAVLVLLERLTAVPSDPELLHKLRAITRVHEQGPGGHLLHPVAEDKEAT